MKNEEGENRSGAFVLALVIGCLIAGLGIFIWDVNQSKNNPVKDTQKSSESPLPDSSSSIFATEASASVDPTPTPRPKGLDDDWDSLPELASPEQIAAAPLESIAETSQPAVASALSLSASDPRKGHILNMPNVIWQAGLLNGTPAQPDDAISSQEYGASDRTDAVLHIRSAEEFPAFLYPGQTLVLHLPGLDPGLYTAHVASTGGTEKSIREELQDKEKRINRLLSIRWNDQLLWKRGFSPVHAITEVVIPPEHVHPESNLLTLVNEAQQVLPLDSVWVQPYQPGAYPFYVAAEQGEWLNREASAWVKQVVVVLPLPSPYAELTGIEPTAPYLAPTTIAEVQARWENCSRRLKQLLDQEHPAVESLRLWHQRIGKAVSRGMIPDVRVDPSDSSEGTLEAAVWVYGDVIHRWILPPGRKSQTMVDHIRAQVPDADIVVMSTSPNSDTVSGKNRYAWWDAQYLLDRAKLYRQFFDRGGDPAAFEQRLNTVINLRVLFFGYMGYKLAWHSDSFHEVVGEYLMESEQGLIIHGLLPGGPFFPAGNDEPSLLWQFTKSIFRFGGPDHRKGIANVLSDSGSVSLRNTSWGVATNGKDSVQVLIHNPLSLNGKLANLELAVPWEGPTRMILHQTASRWDARPPAPETALVRNILKGIPFTPSEGDSGSWLSIPFNLAGAQLFELHPESYVSSRKVAAPEVVAFENLIETDHLFTVSTLPPPAWWSRNKLGAHFYPMWRHSGDVSFQVEVPATNEGTTDWAGKIAMHESIEAHYEAVTPLRESSTRFRFGEGDGKTARVMRAGYHRSRTYKGEVIGLWIRANPPPDFKPKFDSFHAKPQTHFFMGKLPYRQRIDVEYGKWVFITSKASLWRKSVSRHEPFLVFWPGDPVDGNPEIEVNSFEVYQSKLKETDLTPGKCMGFVHEDEEGKLHVLVIGRPGQAAFWRQRLPYAIDSETLRHVVDRELLTTAETPEEDPPEVVRHSLEYFEDSRILEVSIEQIPVTPSDSHMDILQKRFPLIAKDIHKHQLGAVLISQHSGEDK